MEGHNARLSAMIIAQAWTKSCLSKDSTLKEFMSPAYKNLQKMTNDQVNVKKLIWGLCPNHMNILTTCKICL